MALIKSVISGQEFNEKYNNNTFITFIKIDDIDYPHTRAKEINIYTEKSYPRDDFHFYDESKFELSNHVCNNMYDKQISYVKIPNDAFVRIGKYGFKTDRIIFEKLINFSDLPDDFFVKLLMKGQRTLMYIKNQTEELCEYAVKQHGNELQYVENQTNSICEMAVKENVYAFEYVENQTNELCEYVVSKNGNLLQHINFQTKDICKIAIMQNSDALQYVRNQTKELCELAVEKNYLTLRFVMDEPGLISEKTCISIVKKDGLALAFIKESWGYANDTLYKIAIQQNRLAFGIIPKQFRSVEIQNIVFRMPGSYEYHPIEPSKISDALCGTNFKIQNLVMLFDFYKQQYLKNQ